MYHHGGRLHDFPVLFNITTENITKETRHPSIKGNGQERFPNTAKNLKVKEY
jgi:hypothetical protein